MKTITKYYISSFIKLLILAFFLKYSIIYFLKADVALFSFWFILFVNELRDIIDRQKNFLKYYPFFQDKWFNSIL